eukprot:9295334-Lingulodinium_polyedra.AAC.1
MDASADPWAAEPCEMVARAPSTESTEGSDVTTPLPATVQRPVFIIGDAGLGLLGWSSVTPADFGEQRGRQLRP